MNGVKSFDLPITLRKAELTRAEVCGRLGMLPMKVKGQRFSLGYLCIPEFLSQIDSIVLGKGDAILTIPCNDEEINQFEV